MIRTMYIVDWQAEGETLAGAAGEIVLPTAGLRELVNRWQEVNRCGCPHLVEMLGNFWVHFPSPFMFSLNCARSVNTEES